MGSRVARAPYLMDATGTFHELACSTYSLSWLDIGCDDIRRIFGKRNTEIYGICPTLKWRSSKPYG